jgi:hypothetical protein
MEREPIKTDPDGFAEVWRRRSNAVQRTWAGGSANCLSNGRGPRPLMARGHIPQGIQRFAETAAERRTYCFTQRSGAPRLLSSAPTSPVIGVGV